MPDPTRSRQRLVSVGIPTYNGTATLAQTLDSIVSQWFEGMEVVLCDDASTDGTVSLAEAYALEHAFIRVIRNHDNVGMDRNFARTAAHARGTYIWWSGQDDIFEPGAIGKLRDVIRLHEDVDIIYFNYRFVGDDLLTVVAPPPLHLDQDVFVSSAADYFKVVDHAPTFLAATVLRRTLWDNTPHERFLDTHYVQMGAVLHNLAAARVYIVADPRYISCRVPADSWKTTGGQMLFEIHSGSLEVYDTVFHSDRNPLPPSLYRRMMREFLATLPIRVVTFGALGLRRTPVLERRMKRMFGRRPMLYWLYVWPLMHLPRWVGEFALRLHGSRITRWIPRSVNRLLSWFGGRSTA